MSTAVNTETRKTTRLDLRVRPDVKRIIEQAADILGVSTTDFASAALVAEAQAVLDRHHRIILGREDRDRFLRSLEGDEEPTKALVEAAREYELRHSH